ncbi:hypothetical protein H7U37_11130 [Pseudoflavonifractor phocaeensis]|uniref:hypothetical protein n=1 Tax=Pseudoflavonifractor phocaeensis TaxID=1870988 RepID=UPI00195B2D45|nr:hypothetical protein [Pseudoflavonifractor phocaeensis]MBM6871401.1 hypothetical protein [Pseudoflavonifractor phocaeensis]MBM6939068.1 hypothetical protein [Pseudoflavonifractor phocaeensis]
MEMRFVSVEARRQSGEDRVVCVCPARRGGGKVLDLEDYRRRYGLAEEEPYEELPEGTAERPMSWRERVAWLAELTATVSVALMAGGVLALFWLG